jgi:multisubunit Na+/H+ antiporter MnhE subunit
MRTLTVPISDDYRSAVRVAIPLQVVLVFLLTMNLDGGFLALIGLYAVVGFWIGAAIVILRRPRNPLPSDLTYIRWGYLLAFITAVITAMIVTSIRHTYWYLQAVQGR